MSATREISIHREDEERVSRIYSSVLATKALLMVLSFLLMTVIVFSLDKFQSDWLLYYFTFGLVLGNLLLPTWFFQGMEKMRYISILNIGISLIYTAAIFIFVRQPADYTYVPLISALGTIIIGVYSLRLVKRQFGVGFTRPSREDIRHQLLEGWHVFISTVAISLYTISGTFILGFFASNTIVGYFSVAYRIISIANGLLSPISQSIYPYISSLAVKSREEAIYFIKKTTTIMGALSLLVSFLIFIFAGLILYILAGTQYNQSVQLIQIMAFLPFIIALSNMFGVQTMLTFNYKRAFSRIILVGSVINIILTLIMAPFYTAVGISVAMVVTEIYITLAMYLYLRGKGINLLELKRV